MRNRKSILVRTNVIEQAMVDYCKTFGIPYEMGWELSGKVMKFMNDQDHARVENAFSKRFEHFEKKYGNDK